VRLADGREFDPAVFVMGLRYNAYTCQRRHVLLSVDLDEGVTPMFVHCPDDGSRATSSGYPKDPPPPYLFPVRMVWRKATKGEFKQEREVGGRGGYFASGGLAREWVVS
jgi:hypothetical protein